MGTRVSGQENGRERKYVSLTCQVSQHLSRCFLENKGNLDLVCPVLQAWGSEFAILDLSRVARLASLET